MVDGRGYGLLAVPPQPILPNTKILATPTFICSFERKKCAFETAKAIFFRNDISSDCQIAINIVFPVVD